MNLKKQFTIIKLEVKRFLTSIFASIKSNKSYIFLLLFLSTVSLISIQIFAVPFDEQFKSEVLYHVNNNINNIYGYSLNSVELSPIHNSDFYIYSDNNLQNFQMRNQQNKEVRSYVFAAYKPYDNYYPFKIYEQKCSVVLFESKFESNNFYFDVEIIAGKFERYTNMNSIYITDALAETILQQRNLNSLDSLIGSKIEGDTFVLSGISNTSYTIAGVISTESKTGAFLKNVFGENILFVPEYNIFPMKGACYFCGSSNKNENEKIVEYIFENYRPSYGNSRDLSTGYNIKYSFYDFDNNSDKYILDLTNRTLNKIYDEYNNYSLISLIVGLLLYSFSTIGTIILIIISTDRIIKYGANHSLTIHWIVFSISLLLASLFYTYTPILFLISKTKLFTRSHISSILIFVNYLLLMIISFFIQNYKKSKVSLS